MVDIYIPQLEPPSLKDGGSFENRMIDNIEEDLFNLKKHYYQNNGLRLKNYQISLILNPSVLKETSLTELLEYFTSQNLKIVFDAFSMVDSEMVHCLIIEGENSDPT